MIHLKDKNLKDCLELREILHSKYSDSQFSKEDAKNSRELKNKACKELGLNPYDYLLDMQCGILFTKDEQRRGIINLHSHG